MTMHTTPDSQHVEVLCHMTAPVVSHARARLERADDGQLRISTPAFAATVMSDEFLLAVRLIAEDLPETMQRALAAVQAERERQRALWTTEQIPFTCDSEDIQLTSKLGVLVEEVGEVAREVNEADNSLRPEEALRRLRTELIQVAAVAVAWAECLPE